jgi:L-alanine-DL-glutamate epimerase-like enolase superfamily enzyme
MGQSEKLDLKLVKGAREGLGKDAMLLIDAGCVWDARTALQRAHAFAEYGVGWLEEPLHEDDIDGYVWLRDRSPVPIANASNACWPTWSPAGRCSMPRTRTAEARNRYF